MIGNTNEKTVKLREDTEMIAASAFEDSRILEEIEFNNGLKNIGTCAFQCCWNLKSAVIPASVKAINSRAFSDCQNLETVRILGCPEIGSNAFEGSNVKDIYYGGTDNEWIEYCSGNEFISSDILHTATAPQIDYIDGRVIIGGGIKGKAVIVYYRDGVLIDSKTYEIDKVGGEIDISASAAERINVYVYDGEKGRIYDCDKLEVLL